MSILKNQMEVKYFSWGGEFKSTPEGVLEGDAIVFGSPTKTDRSITKDYFSPDTIVNPNEEFIVFLGYEHGFRYREFIGEAKIYRAEGGWKVRAKLDLNNDLVKEKLPEIMSGGWGFSTGAVGHFVDRQKKSNGSNHITKWPVGEISITKTPAEPRALIHAVKCLEEWYGDDDQLPESEPDPKLIYMENLNGELQKVITTLIEQLAKKTVDESFTPQIEEIVKSFTEQVDSVKETLNSIKEEVKSIIELNKEEKPNEEEKDESKSSDEKSEEELKQLTVLKSLEEEKEALLQKNAALLSENKTIEDLNADLEVKKSELKSKEELIKSLEAELQTAKEDTLKEKETNMRLAKGLLK